MAEFWLKKRFFQFTKTTKWKNFPNFHTFDNFWSLIMIHWTLEKRFQTYNWHKNAVSHFNWPKKTSKMSRKKFAKGKTFQFLWKFCFAWNRWKLTESARKLRNLKEIKKFKLFYNDYAEFLVIFFSFQLNLSELVWF